MSRTDMMPLFLFVVALLLLALIYWQRRRWLRMALTPIACLLLLGGGYLLWFEHRSQPSEIEETWFKGVTYARIVRQEPRPMVMHLVRIDLDAPGIDFLVTPPVSDDALPLRGQTTSGFLRQHKLQVAINGSFFHPWHANSPFDYYPHVGDPVSVFGLSISNGKAYTPAMKGCNTLFFTKTRDAFFGSELPDAAHAISGHEVFVDEGQYSMHPNAPSNYKTPEPRTVVALNKSERQLMLIVVDGRQRNYSEGVTLPELADLIREHGGWTALHLDGGGSSTLVRADENGAPIVVNWPIHGRHPPGRERPVANHLGVIAKAR